MSLFVAFNEMVFIASFVSVFIVVFSGHMDVPVSKQKLELVKQRKQMRGYEYIRQLVF